MLKPMMMTAVALLCATWCAGQKAASKSDRLVMFELDIFGPTTEAAIQQAELHAVRSTVGEFYLSDEMLLGRTLLEHYLEKSYKRFVVGESVLSRRESEGTVYLRVSISVDKRALEDDLRQKRFFFKPRRRPTLYVTVAETMDSSPTAGEPITRVAVQEALTQLLIRFEPRVIFAQAANIDLTKDPQQLDAAREVAERSGVEVLLTGQAEMKLLREKMINFDDYFFYNARLTLSLIRVDDGRVLETSSYEAEAGNKDRETAKRVAASRAATKILQDTIPRFAERWERTMTDDAEFQVMVGGVNERQAGAIQDRIATRLKGIQVYRRSLFEDVAVYNLFNPGKTQPTDRESVEQILREIASPRLWLLPTKSEKHIVAKRIPMK